MDVIQAILDGIAIAAIFNGTAAAFVLINPRFFFDSYPKAIQKAAPEKMTKDMEHFLAFPFLLIPIISAAQALLVGFLGR